MNVDWGEAAKQTKFSGKNRMNELSVYIRVILKMVSEDKLQR